jgi:hypothetical protein
METLLLVWLCFFGLLLVILLQDRKHTGALTLSYFVSLSLIHVPGTLGYLGHPYGFEDTYRGLQIAVVGVAAFVGGVAFARFRGTKATHRTIHQTDLDPDWLEKIGRKFLVLGVFVFFIAVPIVGQIPSMTAVVSAFVGLLVIGIWLWLAAAIIRGDRRKQILVLGMLPLLPFATLTFSGFVSFSTQWIITVLSFFFLLSRRKVWFIAAMPVLIFVSLSMFVAYLGERSAIRDLVWEEEANIAARVERISEIFTNFEFLDLSDPRHTGALEQRLNQNALVGAAAANLEDGSATYALGGTVPWWSFVPRVVWPDKPDVGGGGSLVAEYTGIYFAEGTSVGAGQVLEFYVNFGIVGVILGFFAWGFGLMTIDRKIMTAMAEANMPVLLRQSMVGLTLIAPGGNLLEIFVAAIGAFVATPIVLYLDRKLQNLPMAIFAAKTTRLGGRRPRGAE